jgi:hypothetical protein
MAGSRGQIGAARSKGKTLLSRSSSGSRFYEVRWGKAVLAPGDYLLMFTDDNMATTLVIRDAKSSRIAYERADIREDSRGESALLIGGQGHQRVVYSFRAAEPGTTFVCDPKLAHRQAAREEARDTQAVPVLQAKN